VLPVLLLVWFLLQKTNQSPSLFIFSSHPDDADGGITNLHFVPAPKPYAAREAAAGVSTEHPYNRLFWLMHHSMDREVARRKKKVVDIKPL